MYEYLLPIGSVIKLKDAEKPIMIFGILQSNPAVSEKTYDYIGVPYPEGHFDVRLHLGFDHADIKTVVFRGFEDGERMAFLGALEIAHKVHQHRAQAASEPGS